MEAEWSTAFAKYDSMDCNMAGDPIVCGPGEVSERNTFTNVLLPFSIIGEKIEK